MSEVVCDKKMSIKIKVKPLQDHSRASNDIRVWMKDSEKKRPKNGKPLR